MKCPECGTPLNEVPLRECARHRLETEKDRRERSAEEKSEAYADFVADFNFDDYS